MPQFIPIIHRSFGKQVAKSLLIISIFSVAASAQKIPYSYTHGRDAQAMETRYNNFRTAKATGASGDELNRICGDPGSHGAKCPLFGRPSDAETTLCDSMCCLAGHKVGSCGKTNFQFRPDWEKVIEGLVAGEGNPGQGILARLDASIATGCFCSDDWRDVHCGPDENSMRIRCPEKNGYRHYRHYRH